jgi:hypothetical protein
MRPRDCGPSSRLREEGECASRAMQRRRDPRAGGGRYPRGAPRPRAGAHLPRPGSALPRGMPSSTGPRRRSKTHRRRARRSGLFNYAIPGRTGRVAPRSLSSSRRSAGNRSLLGSPARDSLLSLRASRTFRWGAKSEVADDHPDVSSGRKTVRQARYLVGSRTVGVPRVGDRPHLGGCYRCPALESDPRGCWRTSEGITSGLQRLVAAQPLGGALETGPSAPADPGLANQRRSVVPTTARRWPKTLG